MHITNRTLIFFFLVSFSLLTAAGAGASSKQSKWNTSRGPMTLNKTEGYVKGAFKADQSGKLYGIISGDYLRGVWEDGKTGFFEFKLKDRGKGFNGHWGYPGRPWSGSWNGAKLSETKGGQQLAAATTANRRRIKQGHFTVLADEEWLLHPWKKDGTSKGWRLRYQPLGAKQKKYPFSVSFAVQHWPNSTYEEMVKRQSHILQHLKKSRQKKFRTWNMPVAGENALVFNYQTEKSTVFLLFPHKNNTLYYIYIWVRGKVASLPWQINNLLATLALPGPKSSRPAARKPAPASPKSEKKPESLPEFVATDSTGAAGPDHELKPSPVEGACYVAAEATSGRLLTMKLGMPLADVEKKYHVTSNGTEGLRVFKSDIPCLALIKYTFNYKKGFLKEKAFHALDFKVDKTAPQKPVTEIRVKISCDKGMEFSRKLFDWYAETYGPPTKKVNKMDAMTNFGSHKLPVEFWRYWHFKTKDGKPLYFEVKRNNLFEYYVITLRYRK